MSDPQNTVSPQLPEQNPFVIDAFRGLDIDPARFDPDGVYRTYLNVVNALGYFRSFSNKNREKLINLGNKKAEGYDDVNKERYDLDNKIETLGEKKQAIESLFYNKRKEFNSTSNGAKFGWQ